ncbi:MAG: type 1 glutamine amidotransferase [Cytophagales bacterium]|nr:type 1 glutamine amidotransferase [Cytophagales bacterium]
MKPLRLHYFQHVSFEGLGYIQTWASEHGHLVSATHFYEPHHLPSVEDLDWLIVMGGPMGVYDHERFPWLAAEKELIKKAIDANKTVVGICLGAQLIASALGARVYPARKKEIGWFPISQTQAANKLDGLAELPEQITVFHWHGDTFDLPQGAHHLFKTDNCPHQAFLWGRRVLALQFHLEATPQTLTEITKNCRHELVEEEYIQSERQILEQPELCATSNGYLSRIFDRLLAQS